MTVGNAIHAYTAVGTAANSRTIQGCPLKGFNLGGGLFPVRSVAVDLEQESADGAVKLLEICRRLRVEKLL